MKQPLEILHLSAGNMFGGVERFLVTLAESQTLCPDLRSSFGLCFDAKCAADLRQAGARVTIFGAVKLSRIWTVWRARNRLADLLRQKAFDVVIFHGAWLQAVFGPVVRKFSSRLIFWMHDLPSGTHRIEKLAQRTQPDLVIADSQFTASFADRIFPGVAKQVLYYPVAAPKYPCNYEKRNALRKKLNCPEDAVAIVTTARLERWKGQAALIEALGRLKDNQQWRCWIAGGVQRPHEQDFLNQLQARVSELGIQGRVQFLGQRNDVPELLAAADIHCQPNIGPEPFGIAFVEALYAGLPVVTCAHGGALEIVTSDCGLLVQANDVAALGNALRVVITDSEKRSSLALGGPKRARDLCDPAARLENLYDILQARLIWNSTKQCVVA